MSITLGKDDWWKGAVVYQIYPRSFADSNGDGIGDIPGITSKLDYLADLGVDVLWLSPVYKSPQDDNGYDISDYQDIDPLFGTLEDMRHLINETHARGMKLVMDLVVNHTSDEHPWFVESSSSLDNPKRDWYIWRDAVDGREPTSHQSAFSGSAWQWDENTQQYFLHIFSKKQPDLNWENPDVRAAVYSMMNWWLEQGVDGFRMDVINLISKRQDFSDAEGLFGPWMNGPRIHEFLQEMNREVLRDKGLITVGEMPGCTIQLAQEYTAPERHEVNMVFTFEHMNLDTNPDGFGKWDLAPFSVKALKENLNKWQKGLEQVGWNSLYWNNHDQPRIVSRWGNDSTEHRVNSAKAFGTVLHLMRGTPYVYQGEEIGMTNAHFTKLSQYRDLETLNWAAEASSMGITEDYVLKAVGYKGRDNARTPMQWDDSPNAGFSSGEPWISVNTNYPEINAAGAVADADSVFHHYQKLIAMRHGMDVVVNGSFDMLWIEHEHLFAYERKLNGQVLTVVANLSNDTVELPESVSGDAVLGVKSDVLAPWQAFVTVKN
ncbi:alpha-glucosidase [Aurantimicrobium sp. INA4]|uniref:alpha-glucosidase n=1 Tax=Aurantimicrobium sp. INA4 TaxID=2986279 RepID=UPI002491371D|nr:alpha-glucosidase [Aurantimicrobium sp. INA4]BDU11488.1 alpha-glucosidase [Aurantimicrobium sp. INA4]